MALTGIFDIVAHFDLPKRSGHLATETERDDITRTLQEIARAGMCMEINTSGYRHHELAKPDPYPDFRILEDALALRIPLTVNSDAHAGEHVGTAFPDVADKLIKLGCRSLAQYTERKRELFAL
jgi:histidinol-phosphatase (PHP family)